MQGGTLYKTCAVTQIYAEEGTFIYVSRKNVTSYVIHIKYLVAQI